MTVLAIWSGHAYAMVVQRLADRHEMCFPEAFGPALVSLAVLLAYNKDHALTFLIGLKQSSLDCGTDLHPPTLQSLLVLHSLLLPRMSLLSGLLGSSIEILDSVLRLVVFRHQKETPPSQPLSSLFVFPPTSHLGSCLMMCSKNHLLCLDGFLEARGKIRFREAIDRNRQREIIALSTEKKKVLYANRCL